MDSRVNYALLGLFVLGLGAALIGGILWLGTGGLVQKNYKRYAMYSSGSVASIGVDSKVKYQGVDVGRVVELDLVPDHPSLVRVLLQIEQGTPIRQDTVATIEMLGVTGLGYVNLKGGRADSPPLQPRPGQVYPVIKSQPSLFGRLANTATTLLDNLSQTSGRLNDLLSPDNQKQLGQTLEQLNRLSADLAKEMHRIGPIIDDLGETMKRTRQASEGFPGLVEQFRATAGRLEKMAAEIQKTTAFAHKRLAKGSEALGRFGRTVLPETQSMVKELRETSVNLRRMSEQLERDPSVLLLGPPQPKPGPGE